MNPEKLLKKGLKEMRISCSEAQREAFITYLTELKKWSRAYNLTGLRTDEDIVIKHFLDSLLYLRTIPKGTLKVADAGSGAGFPGIPIKIIRPEIELTLIESSRKKATFLRHMLRVLALDKTEVLQKRIEELGEAQRGRYDIIVSRATFSIKDFHKKACPYVKKDGILVLSKGRRVYEELERLGKIPHIKASIKKILKVRLPFIKDRRNLVVLECQNFHNLLKIKEKAP